MFVYAQQNKGNISGSVSESMSGYPLEGANITVQGSEIGTTSDANGQFTIRDLKQGYYTLIISFIGFESIVIPDVWVRPNAYDFITAKLNQKVIEFEDIVVEDSYFSRSGINMEQSIIFRNDEIRRAPGAAQELSRILNSLPSVASVGENRQDLMVRGGGPTENGFIVDNIHLPNISHFGMEDGRSNGPIGMINTELIDNIEFYSNGFPAKYGSKLSSFGEISYRNGNKNALEGNVSMGIGGAGMLLEGPLLKNTTFIASYRRSYLDVIAGLLNAGGLPSYDDLQGKITYKPNSYNIFTFFTVSGNSLYQRKKEEAIEEDLSQHGKRKNKQNTVGINYKRLWNERAFSNTSYSFTNQKVDAAFIELVDGRTSSSVDNDLTTTYFRNINQIKIGDASNIEFGLETRMKFANFNFLLNDLSIKKDVTVQNNYAFFTFRKLFYDRISISTGLRASNNSFESNVNFSPRLNLKLTINPLTSLIFSSGKYYQNPHEIYLSIDSNDKLTSVYSTQNSLTFERLITASSKFSISIYEKSYQQAPVHKDEKSKIQDLSFLMDRFQILGDLTSDGTAKASGIEFLIEKKRAENFYGHIGGTLFNATYKDLNGDTRNRDYNYRYIFNIVGGYRPKEKWEISVRWSLFGGKPYTPIDELLSSKLGYEVLFEDQNNEEKTPVYHSLFIRYDYRKNYGFGNLIGYMELWNAYNRKNIENYFWDSGLKEETYFNLIPVVGLELEF